MGTVDLHELKVYQLAMRVGEDVWALTAGWEWVSKQTVGVPWVRAADSIAANIAEGFGRCSAKENVRFCYEALGALRQTQTWLEKATARRLVVQSAAGELSQKLETLRRQLENYIDSFEINQPNAARETTPRDGSIHLLPLEELFYPRPPAWNS